MLGAVLPQSLVPETGVAMELGRSTVGRGATTRFEWASGRTYLQCCKDPPYNPTNKKMGLVWEMSDHPDPPPCVWSSMNTELQESSVKLAHSTGDGF